jgi:hypothetical protein
LKFVPKSRIIKIGNTEEPILPYFCWHLSDFKEVAKSGHETDATHANNLSFFYGQFQGRLIAAFSAISVR